MASSASLNLLAYSIERPSLPSRVFYYHHSKVAFLAMHLLSRRSLVSSRGGNAQKLRAARLPALDADQSLGGWLNMPQRSRRRRPFGTRPAGTGSHRPPSPMP